MTNDEFYKLESGDIILNRGSGLTYIVVDIIGRKLIAVRTVTVSNPDEWDIVKKGQWENEKAAHRGPSREGRSD